MGQPSCGAVTPVQAQPRSLPQGSKTLLASSPANSAEIHSDPFESACTPGVDEGHTEQQDEDHTFDRTKQRKPVVRNRPREEEDHFDIEDKEDESEDVVLDLELYPGVADRLDAAFVRRVLELIRTVRPEDSPQDNGRHGNQD